MDKLKFTDAMIDRIDAMDQAVYQMCLAFLQIDCEKDDLEEFFPWNAAIIQEIYDLTVSVLRKHQYQVCDPSIIRDKEHGDCFCHISECGYQRCNLHPEK